MTGIDSYIAAQPADIGLILLRVRDVIRSVLPEAEEGISYQIPAFRVEGVYALYFASFKAHYSLYPVTAALRASLGGDADAYAHGKATVRFCYQDPVPVELIQRIARARVAEVAEDRRTRAARRGRRPSG